MVKVTIGKDGAPRAYELEVACIDKIYVLGSRKHKREAEHEMGDHYGFNGVQRKKMLVKHATKGNQLKIELSAYEAAI